MPIIPIIPKTLPKASPMKFPQHQYGLAFLPLLAAFLVGVIALFLLYIWVMLSWSYSYGERAGWVQKLSKKGFLCKTWEGEMAMVSLPGSVPEKFVFTIRDDHAAEQVNKMMGRRVALQYEQHIGLPTSCFGETDYFIKGLVEVQDTAQVNSAPITVQSVPGAVSPSVPPTVPPTPPAQK